MPTTSETVDASGGESHTNATAIDAVWDQLEKKCRNSAHKFMAFAKLRPEDSKEEESEKLNQHYFRLKTENKVVTKTQRPHITIRKRPNWTLETAVRELLQNMIDYLELVDRTTMRLKDTVRLDCKTGKTPDAIEISFNTVALTSHCLARIFIGTDTLRIVQYSTFPLPWLTMHMHVQDRTKARGRSAGGFGVGAKDAYIAILQKEGDIKVTGTAGPDTDTGIPHGARDIWKLESVESSYGTSTLESSPTMVVKTALKVGSSTAKTRHKSMGEAHTLEHDIKAKRIGKAAIRAIHKFQVFWAKSDIDCVIVGADRGDAIMDVNQQKLEQGLHMLLESRRLLLPLESGIYVKGIFVSQLHANEFPLGDSAMLQVGFDSNVNVSNSDRNHVHSNMIRRFISSVFATQAHQMVGTINGNNTTLAAKQLRPLFPIDTSDDNTSSWLVRSKDHDLWGEEGLRQSACTILGVNTATTLLVETGAVRSNWRSQLAREVMTTCSEKTVSFLDKKDICAPLVKNELISVTDFESHAMGMVCDAARKEVAEQGMVDGVRVVTDIIKNMLDSDCMPKFDVLSIPAGMETPNMLDILGPRTVFARECRKTGVLRMFFRRSINKASHRLIKAVASELHQHAEWLCSDGIRNEYEWSEKMLGIVTMAVRYDKQGVELGDWEAQYGSMGAGADSDDEYERKRKYGHNQTLRVHKRIKVQCAQCISRESQLAARMAALATARATLAS